MEIENNNTGGSLESRMMENRENPPVLERLYREDRKEFTRIFSEIYKNNPDSIVLSVWNERLFYKALLKETPETPVPVLKIIIFSLAAAILGKLFYYLIEENILSRGMIFFSTFPALTAFFLLKRGFHLQTTIITVFLTLLVGVSINVLHTDVWIDDAEIISFAHLPLLLWSLVGIAYCGDGVMDNKKRMAYLNYTGETIIYTVIILICGVLLTLATIGLFSFIGIDIFSWYLNNIVVMGITAAPVVATHIYHTQKKTGFSAAPLISRIFSPLLALTLLIYLLFVFTSGKNPFDDREFLFVLNVLLLGVMAVKIFVITKMKDNGKKVFHYYSTALLGLLALIIDIIALSASGYRLFTLGITPNRLTVFSIAAMVCVHLILIIIQYGNYLFFNGSVDSIKRSVTVFLPVYSIWSFIAVIGFPLFL